MFSLGVRRGFADFPKLAFVRLDGAKRDKVRTAIYSEKPMLSVCVIGRRVDVHLQVWRMQMQCPRGGAKLPLTLNAVRMRT